MHCSCSNVIVTRLVVDYVESLNCLYMQPSRLQQQRLSLADTSSDEQKRLKEKAVHFADQAIEGAEFLCSSSVIMCLKPHDFDV